MRAHEMTQLTCENMIVIDQGNGTVIFVLPEDADGGTINVEADGLQFALLQMLNLYLIFKIF